MRKFPKRGAKRKGSVPGRSWRAALIRGNKLQVLGEVEAASHDAAEAAAVRTFNLNPEQRSRLILQELGKYYE